MTAYALAHLHNPRPLAQIVEYLERIQDTLDPFGGRFLVHGAPPEVIEGPWPGTVVVIEFPDLEAARTWYASPAYQQILPLRTDNIDGQVIFVPGVPDGYDARATAASMRALLA